MARSDISLGSTSTSIRASQSAYLVITPSGGMYNFIYYGDNSLYWQSSFDNGFTWSGKNLIKALASGAFAVWYDRWTPGVTTDVVHLAYFESTGDDVFYRSFDLATESLGSEITVFAGGSTSAIAGTCISITKAIGGNIYVAFDIDGGTETGFYRSTDGGATFGSRTDVNEGTSDYYKLTPGFAADTQDIMCMFWDRSNDEISRKIYDDSGNSWGESSIATAMVDLANSTASPQFDITVDDANNKILLVAWSNADTANADLRFWTIDESSITEGTNVVLNSTDDQGMTAISLVSASGVIYVFYGGKSDGSETFPTSINFYYKSSSDGGSTWGSETKITTLTRNYDFLYSCPIILDSLGKIFAAFQLQTASIDELLLSVEHPAGGGGVATSIFGGGVVR